MTTKTTSSIQVKVMTIREENMRRRQVKGQMKHWQSLVNCQANIVIDLGRVKSIDSAGLAALVTLLDQVEATGRKLAIANMSAPVQVVAGLVSLHKVIELYSTVDLAIQSTCH